jgi:hypothetical protein
MLEPESQASLRPAALSPIERALPPVILLLTPLLVLLGDRTLIFNHRGYLDPWVYYGLYRNLAALKTLFPAAYYPSRLSLILPGYLVNQIFAPLTANYVLHLLVWLGAVGGLYLTVKEIASRRSALVAATVFGFFPYLWRAVGWDYPDGIGNAYYLLTVAFLTVAARDRLVTRRYLFLAGITCAGALYCNLTWAFLLPSFGPYWLFVRKARGYPIGLGRTLVYSGAGFLFLTLLFAVVNYRLTGDYLFYLPSITYAISGVQTPSPYGVKGAQWLLTSPWLYLPLAALLAGPLSLARFRRRQDHFHARMVVALYVNLLFCAAVLTAWELAGQPLLQIPYYASYLLAPTFLFLGVAVFPLDGRLRTKSFCLFLAATIGACAWVWWDPAGRTWQWLFQLGAIGLIAIVAIVMGGAFPGRTWAVSVAVVGISLLSLTARSTVTGFWENGGGSPERAQQAFLRIVESIEISAAAAKPAQMLRFWFDNSDKNGIEFSSINSSYLYAPTKIPSDYPEAPDSLYEGLVAILSSLPGQERRDAWLKAQESLKQVGIKAHVVSDHVIDRGGVRYGLTIIRQELDMNAVRAFGYIRNGGFESGAAAWTGGWAKTRVIEGGQSGRGLELEAERGPSQYVMQWNFARLQKGKKYKFIAWTKSGSSGDEPFVVGVWDNNASRFVAAKEGRTSPEWQRNEVEFQNDTDNLLSVELIKKSPSKGTMLFDSIGLTEVQ